MSARVFFALRIGGKWLHMRRRGGHTTSAQLPRIGVRAASRMSVEVDAAADVEPETAGRKGRNGHSANVRLAADCRQAFTRRIGCDLRIALRARGERAVERCAQRGPALAVDKSALCAIPTTARRRSTHAAGNAASMQTSSAYHPQG
jgi:hypothetical protein